jgi:hypothetical protein
MPLTPGEMDELMDHHFAFEMADDVDGVLTTLAPNAEHDIVGAPDGPTIGLTETRPTYEQVFADLAGERVETLHRYYGDNALIDESLWIGRAVGHPLGIPGRNRPLRFRILHVIEFNDTGLITRENVWLDYPSISAQLTDGAPNTYTNEHHNNQEGQPQ